MSAKPLTTKNTLMLIWNVINFIRKLVLNIVFFPLFFIALIAVVIAMVSSDEIQVEDGSALVLNLAGGIVDQKRQVDPFEAMLSQSKGPDVNGEILLSDVLYTINSATNDKRIKALVLDLSELQYGGLSKLSAIGQALNEFKDSGKPVVAIGNYYDQNQYFLASFADYCLPQP